MHRRRFFHWCSLLLSGLAVAAVVVPGVGFLIDPLRSSGKKGKQHRLLKLVDLTVGVPRKLVITDRRVDAWTRYPEGPVGAVWLIRHEDGTVLAFSTTCPHLGCPVDYVAAEDKFYCPCHEASYANDGTAIGGPQPRGLDELDVTLEKVGDDEWVSVVFERFKTGVAEKISLG